MQFSRRLVVVTQYRYDLAGNRTRVTYGGAGRELVSTYDAVNRLSTMTESGRTMSYAYNASGAVSIRTLPNGDATSTIYDPSNQSHRNVLAELLTLEVGELSMSKALGTASLSASALAL